ncbi:MAG: L-threonylcarbamoyladenylate synthase [Candidatus Woesearchaeota archaeon]|jgi:L-threonylcarbamoyladenylate synthase
MKTLLLKPAQISKAAKILQQGGLVAFPTETVYGLGANALDEKAVKKIFVAKGRPADNPLIVHIADKKMLPALVKIVPSSAKKLIKKFWPGPLTIILNKKEIIPDIVTAGGKTVAIRMPDHPLAYKLIKLSKLSIAAPSANLSGRPSPTSAKHVIDDMKGRVEGIIDGGNCQVGLESTVIDLTGKVPILLRPGAVTLEQLRKVLGEVKVANPESNTPKSPGMKYQHYSPETPVVLIKGDIEKKIIALLTTKKNLALILSKSDLIDFSSIKADVYFYEDLNVLAHEIFSLLRDLDKKKYGLIVIQEVSEEGIGRAIMNRLRKAASKNL